MEFLIILHLVYGKETDLRRGRHVVFNLHVHLVFVAKYRRKVFTKEILDDMRQIFESVCTDFEAQLVEFDGENDMFICL